MVVVERAEVGEGVGGALIKTSAVHVVWLKRAKMSVIENSSSFLSLASPLEQIKQLVCGGDPLPHPTPPHALSDVTFLPAMCDMF